MITPTYFSGFPAYQNFKNTIDATVTALLDFIVDRYFMGDSSRAIISSTEMALRNRAKGNAWSNANLPFFNLGVPSVNKDVARPWYVHRLAVEGVWVPELQRKVKMLPIKISFECNLFYHNMYDVQFAMFRAIQEEHFEDRLSIPMKFENGQELNLIGILEYNLDTNPQYTEKDFLERNKIRTITLDPTVDTYVIWDVPVFPAKKILFSLDVDSGSTPLVEEI